MKRMSILVKQLLMLFTLCWGASAFAATANLADLLAKHDTYTGVKVSPDGKHLGIIVRVDNKKVLLFLSMDGFKPVGQAKFPGSTEVGNYHWVNNERVVISLAETQPWSVAPSFYGELFAINYDGSQGELVFGYRAGEMQTGTKLKVKQAQRAWGEVIDTLSDDEDNILISSTGWSNGGDRYSDVLLLNVYTGKSRKVTRAPVPQSTFLTNSKGEIRVALATNEKNKAELYYFQDKQWNQIPSDKLGDKVGVVAVNNSDDGVILLDQFNASQQGLSELKFKDASRELIYRDPAVEITAVGLTQKERQAYVMRIDDGKPAYLLIKGEQQESSIFKDLLSAFPDQAVSITSQTKDDNIWVVLASSDTNPGTYYLYKRKDNALVKLFDSRPELLGVKLANTEAIQFKSFDQLPVSGFITPAVNGKSKSMVVLIHGGPHGVRDYWGFDSEVHLLSQSGFNVLQVNYRGSGGYGANFEAAGYRQWGAAVQQDIIAATQWAIAQGHADADKVCIMGGSFGAYAAVQSSILSPDLYRCAVGVAGVYDLPMMKTEGDIPLSSFGISYLEDVLGSDAKELDLFSPARRVAELKVPLLIAHGERDKRAPMEQAETLRKALDKHKKTYQWLEFDDESHGFYDPENRSKYFKQVTQFIHQHIP